MRAQYAVARFVSAANAHNNGSVRTLWAGGLAVSPVSTVNSLCLDMLEKWKWDGWPCGVPSSLRTHIEVCAVLEMRSMFGKGEAQ